MKATATRKRSAKATPKAKAAKAKAKAAKAKAKAAKAKPKAWRPKCSPSEMTDRTVRGTSLYRALRALNADLAASDVLEMARENIERKWVVIEAEREAEAERQEEAEAQKMNAQRRLEASEAFQAALDGNNPLDIKIKIRREGYHRTIDIDIDDAPCYDWRVVRVIRRLRPWMEATNGEDRGQWQFGAPDIARLIGCVPLTIQNWLNGTTRQPYQLHEAHLHAMMENYTIARLRTMLVSGERVSCGDDECCCPDVPAVPAVQQ